MQPAGEAGQHRVKGFIVENAGLRQKEHSWHGIRRMVDVNESSYG
jgi:hypothetical protein